MFIRSLLSTAARSAFKTRPPALVATRAYSGVGQGPHASTKSMTKLEPEVYPLIVIILLATSGATYMMLQKLTHDQDLRLLPTNIRSPIHEELDYQKQRFGVQAGGHTYKDVQGWTRIAVNEKKV